MVVTNNISHKLCPSNKFYNEYVLSSDPFYGKPENGVEWERGNFCILW
jgi:hypothetical protein